MLRDDADQAATCVFEGTARGAATLHERPPAPVGTKTPRHEQPVVDVIDQLPHAVERIVGQHAGGDAERGLNLNLLGVWADQTRLALGAQHQPERTREDGLASTGLAGNHGHARGGLDLCRAEDDEVVYLQPLQHG